MLPDRRARFSLYGRTGSSLEDDNRGKTTTVRVGIVVPTDGENGREPHVVRANTGNAARRKRTRLTCNGIRDQADKSVARRKRFRVPRRLQDQTDVILTIPVCPADGPFSIAGHRTDKSAIRCHRDGRRRSAKTTYVHRAGGVGTAAFPS